MTTVRYSAEAKREHREAVLYYEEQRRGLGSDFVDAVDTAVERLEFDPTSWPIVMQQYRRCPVTGFPYDLIFLPRESDVMIMAVAHHRRRSGYWQNRLSGE